MDILPEMPEIVRQYALYYRNIKGRAPKTVNEYCSDLRTFFRFMKHFRGYVSQDTPMEEIPIDDIDLEFIRSITTMDIHELRCRRTQQHELHASAKIFEPQKLF